jgi:hypothetical protein
MNLANLTASELFIVEWQYRMLGDFKKGLIEAICRADEINLHKLSLGFPDEVEGYENYSRVDGWWRAVQEKAEIKGE